MGAHAEVLDSLTGVLGTTEQQGVAASRRTQSELIEGQGLTAGCDNASTGSGSESESSDAQLGDRQETVVIGDSGNDDDGLAILILGDVVHDARQRDRGSVDAGHEQTAKDDLVEGRVGSAYAAHGKISNEFTSPPNPIGDSESHSRFRGVNLRARKR